jgi:hypothetical protein
MPLRALHLGRVPPGMNEIDDFLGLRRIDFSMTRMVLFHGISGSGKSTAIRFLAEHHTDFEDVSFDTLSGPPFRSGPPRPRRPLIIDEILRPRDLVDLMPSMMRAGKILVATHVSPLWLLPLRIRGRQRVFRTDAPSEKLARHLQRNGIAASETALARYETIFGATYTDLDVILERCPSPTLDESLRRFERFCRIECTPFGAADQ